MSGTASLSAAKNRLSGNEVKFNGQPKQPIQTQNIPQRSAPPQNGKQVQPPHPLVILKSHELRLQKIETNDNTDLNYSSLIKDFISHKEDYLRFKQEYILFKNSIKSEKNIYEDNFLGDNSMQSDNTTQFDTYIQFDKPTQIQTYSNLEGDILSLHRRIDDIHNLITSFSLELSNITQHYKSNDKCEEKVTLYKLILDTLIQDKLTLDKLTLDKLTLDKLTEHYKEKDDKEKDDKEKDDTSKKIVIPDRFLNIDIHDNIYDNIQPIKIEEPNIQLEILDSNNTTAL